ncbi:MAG: hypothetical protein K2M00_05885, partial [Muribaculaceae bacterium]|nr:hypothetical protein [Muribaculaceae bacterium]
DYNDPLIDTGDTNGTSFTKPDGTIGHRIRCRFQTINAITAQQNEKIVITQENFNPGVITFTRK